MKCSKCGCMVSECTEMTLADLVTEQEISEANGRADLMLKALEDIWERDDLEDIQAIVHKCLKEIKNEN